MSQMLIVIVAIIFGTTSRERLVRGLKPTNCDSPAVTSPNNHYERYPGGNGITSGSMGLVALGQRESKPTSAGLPNRHR